MRVGQQSAVWFLGQVGASFLAFLATVYFARVLGASALGTYSLVLAIAAWVKFPTSMGIGGAITKRVSEGRDQPAFMTAGALLLGVLTVAVAVVVVIAGPLFDSYVGYPATEYLVAILFVGTATRFVHSSLKGQHLVHVSGVLEPVAIGSRSVFQFVLVFFTGLGVAGMLSGYVLGTLLVVLVGLYLLPGGIELPTWRHFRSLLSYAQFSWLSTVRSKVFNWVDVVVLGFFFSSSLVGIYSVSWTLASFLGLFSGAVRSAMFPEISGVTERKSSAAVGGLVEASLSYTGLFLIPGFFGALVLGDRVLRVYGPEFPAGSTVLVVLVLAYLVHSYGKQMINVLNGVDRPDLAFRVSLVYIVLNLISNVALVWAIGWIGAALATFLSAVAGVMISFWYVDRVVNFRMPLSFLGKQWLAAGVMAVVVYGLRAAVEGYGLGWRNEVVVVVLAGIGAGLYLAILLAISSRFRTTIYENAPLDVPV